MHGVRLVGLCVLAFGGGLLLYFGVYAGASRAFKAAGVARADAVNPKVDIVMRRGIVPAGIGIAIAGAILMAF